MLLLVLLGFWNAWHSRHGCAMLTYCRFRHGVGTLDTVLTLPCHSLSAADVYVQMLSRAQTHNATLTVLTSPPTSNQTLLQIVAGEDVVRIEELIAVFSPAVARVFYERCSLQHARFMRLSQRQIAHDLEPEHIDVVPEDPQTPSTAAPVHKHNCHEYAAGLRPSLATELKMMGARTGRPASSSGLASRWSSSSASTSPQCWRCAPLAAR